MKEYRILEVNGDFYPQHKVGNEWHFYVSDEFTNVEFWTLEKAKTFLDSQSELEPKEIIHEYKPKEDGKQNNN
jgi:hypothetical protein